MIMNKLMEPHWQAVRDWSSLPLTADLDKILESHLRDLNEDEDSHVHLLDLGIEKDLLRYGLRITARLFELYSISDPTSPLEAFISLDDGSELEDWEQIDDEPWFDCAIHFHVKDEDGTQFMNPATIERCVQPVIIVDSNDRVFLKHLVPD